MDLAGDEIVDMMNEVLQGNTGQSGGNAYQYAGKDQELGPVHAVFQPVQNDLIAPGFPDAIPGKVPFEF